MFLQHVHNILITSQAPKFLYVFATLAPKWRCTKIIFSFWPKYPRKLGQFLGKIVGQSDNPSVMLAGQNCQCGIADWPCDEQTSDLRRLRQSSYRPWNKNVYGIERTEMFVRLHAEKKQVFGNNSRSGLSIALSWIDAEFSHLITNHSWGYTKLAGCGSYVSVR